MPCVIGLIRVEQVDRKKAALDDAIQHVQFRMKPIIAEAPHDYSLSNQLGNRLNLKPISSLVHVIQRYTPSSCRIFE